MSGSGPSPSIAIIGLGAIGRIVLDGIVSSGRSGSSTADGMRTTPVAATEGEADAKGASTGDGAHSRAAAGDGESDARVTAVVVRPVHLEAARACAPPGISVVTTLDQLDRGSVNLVVECAGQDSVAEFGERALRLGADLMVIATGALADDALRGKLTVAAAESGSRILLPAGAIAGLDGLRALRRGGLASVRYVAVKPPKAWIGTPAEKLVDLEALVAPATFFRGSAGEAARLYPKNANISATVALAGVGFDDTEVELVADPTTSDNVGRIEAEGTVGRMELVLRGPPMPDNPRTSVVTAHSILEAIESPHRTIVV